MRLITRRVVAPLLAALLMMLTANPSSADWRDEIKVLKIGVLAGGDSTYRTMVLEPFRAYLQQRIGIAVEIVPVGSYSALIDAQIGARIQYAIHSASASRRSARRSPPAAPSASIRFSSPRRTGRSTPLPMRATAVSLSPARIRLPGT